MIYEVYVQIIFSGYTTVFTVLVPRSMPGIPCEMPLCETWGDYKGIVLSSFPKCTRPIWRTEIVGFCLRLVAVFLHEKRENMEDMHQNDERDSSSNSSVEDSSPDNSDEEEEEKVVSIVSLSFLARAEVDLLILFCSSLLYVVFLFPVL